MLELHCVEVAGKIGFEMEQNVSGPPDISPTRKGCSANTSVTLGMISQENTRTLLEFSLPSCFI